MGSPRSAPREPECPCAESNVVFTLDFLKELELAISTFMSLEVTETTRCTKCTALVIWGDCCLCMGGLPLRITYGATTRETSRVHSRARVRACVHACSAARSVVAGMARGGSSLLIDCVRGPTATAHAAPHSAGRRACVAMGAVHSLSPRGKS